MKLDALLRQLGRKADSSTAGYAVAFQWIDLGGKKMVHDSTPDKSEPALPTEADARAYAAEMAQSHPDQWCNIEVIYRTKGKKDGKPVPGCRTLLPRDHTKRDPLVWAYTRGSTIEQQDTLDQQFHRVKQYKAAEPSTAAIEWGEVVVESGVSATSIPWMERPEAYKLQLAMQPGDHLIIPKLDRAFRNLKDYVNMLDYWMSEGIYVHMLDVGMNTTNPITMPFLKMLGSVVAIFAEMETQQLSARKKEANEARRRAGKPLAGTPPIGWKYVGPLGDRNFGPNMEDRRTMEKIVRWVESGESIDQIYYRLLHGPDKTLRRITRGHRSKNPGDRWIPWSWDVIETGYRNMKLIQSAQQNGVPDRMAAIEVAGRTARRAKVKLGKRVKVVDTSCQEPVRKSVPWTEEHELELARSRTPRAQELVLMLRERRARNGHSQTGLLPELPLAYTPSLEPDSPIQTSQTHE